MSLRWKENLKKKVFVFGNYANVTSSNKEETNLCCVLGDAAYPILL